jgi:hypothetical protein
MKTKHKIQLIFIMLFPIINAQVNITRPSLDVGACSLPSSYFKLGNIKITETQNGDFATGTAKTIIFSAPTGLQFLANTGVVSATGGKNLSGESITVTSSIITVQFNCSGTNKLDLMTISGLKVRASNVGLYSLSRSAGTAIINGLTNGTTITGNLGFTTVSSNLFRTNPTISGKLDWNQSSTWECNAVPPNDGSANVIIRAYQNNSYNSNNAVFFSGLPNIQSLTIESNANFSSPSGSGKNLTILGDFTIKSGGTYQQINWSQSGINSIQIGGNFINNGSMVSSSGNGGNGLRIEMNGTTPQIISGSGFFRMIGNGPGTGSLVISNQTGVELQSNFLTDNSNGNIGTVIIDGLMTFSNPNIKFFGIGNLQLNGKTVLKAGTFNEHYAMTGTKIIANTSTIEYTNISSFISSTNIPSLNLNNLIINNTISGITSIENPLSVGGTLSLLGGNVINGVNTIQIGTSQSNKGLLTYSSGVIIGKVKRWFSGTNIGNQTGLFPIGNSFDFQKRFAKVEYTQPSDGGSITAEWTNQSMGSIVTNEPIATSCNGTFTISNTASGFWTMTPADGILNSENKNYNITLSANNLNDFSNDCHITAVKRDNNNIWSNSGAHLDNTGTAINPTITRLNASGWSNWGLGGEGGDPLPVELSSLSAECLEKNIIINWVTASENNSASFILEKSENCMQWIISEEVAAAGFSNELLNYSIVDNRVEGLFYYRLSQKDFDGKMRIYDPIHAECKDESPFTILLWPNPSENGFNLFINDNSLKGSCTISMKNSLGIEVLNKQIYCDSGMNLFQFSDLSLPAGMYFVQVSNDINFSKVIKHLIK